MTHPVDEVYVDGVLVAKASVRSYSKQRLRHRAADVDEIRNNDWSGQFAGLFISSLGANFDLDTGDMTTPDDGISCIVDSEGNRFKVGSGGSTLTDREVTAAGDVTIDIDDELVRINKTVSQVTAVLLPAAADFAKGQLIIKDQKGDSTTYPISVTPDGSETIDGQSGVRLIDWPYGGLRLRPVSGGWLTLP